MCLSLAIEACIASYPGLFIPVSVACSINVGEDLVKMITCSDIPVHNLWRAAYSFCTDVWLLSEPKKRHQDCLMSTAHSLHGLWLQSVVHSLNCGFSGNVPTSRYNTAHDQFYQASPVLVLQVTVKCWGKKAWVRGYSTHACTCRTCLRDCDESE